MTKVEKNEIISEYNLVESFLFAKRIDGYSEKNLKYYDATVQTMLHCIGKEIE